MQPRHANSRFSGGTARFACLALGLLALSACSANRFQGPLSENDANLISARSAATARKNALGGPAQQSATAAKPAVTTVDIASEPMGPVAVDIINERRAQKGLKPLIVSAELTRAAQEHALDIAAHKSLSHFGSNGSSPIDRVRRAGFRPGLAAENVASGPPTIEDAIKIWTESATHERNMMLADATHMGVATATDPKDSGTRYWALVVAAAH